MPELVTYKGKPVRRRIGLGSRGLRLIFFSAVPGQPGQQLEVSNGDWQQHSQRTFYENKADFPPVRELAEAAGRLPW